MSSPENDTTYDFILTQHFLRTKRQVKCRTLSKNIVPVAFF